MIIVAHQCKKSLIFHSKFVILIQNPRFPRCRYIDDCKIVHFYSKCGRRIIRSIAAKYHKTKYQVEIIAENLFFRTADACAALIACTMPCTTTISHKQGTWTLKFPLDREGFEQDGDHGKQRTSELPKFFSTPRATRVMWYTTSAQAARLLALFVLFSFANFFCDSSRRT